MYEKGFGEIASVIMISIAHSVWFKLAESFRQTDRAGI